MSEQNALGMIETKGLVGLIEASDAAVKAAKVVAVHYERTGGGLCIIKLRGTVGAVKAAIEAGSQAAMKVGELISSHVIPNPVEDIEPMINPIRPPATQKPAVEFHKWRRKQVKTKAGQTLSIRFVADDEKFAKIMNKLKKSGIESLDYNEIRYLARRIDGFPMTKSQIRNAGKRQILEIFKSYEVEIID